MEFQTTKRMAAKLFTLIRTRPQLQIPRTPRTPAFRTCRQQSFQTTALRRSVAQSKATTQQSNKNTRINPTRITVLASGAVLSVLLATIHTLSTIEESNVRPPIEDSQHASATNDGRDPSLPRYRLTDIRKHDSQSSEPWVTSGDKVYDITDWISAHPGGDVILRAAGGSIDPYWDIFSIHKAPHVYDILSQYLIGYIDVADLVDGKPAAEAIEDPFEQDPVRDSRLITHTARPQNAEPPNSELGKDFITPNELFYVRNHMWVPVVEEAAVEEHKLAVELPDGDVKTYTLADLRSRFKTYTITAALQCSGNRRNDMTRHAGSTNGLQWGVGAISNAEWEGVRLADVLADAGLNTAPPSSADLHVQFSGLEAYGASIPLPVALDPRADVLLAFAMNGRPLPRDHGYPLRTVVPGHVAARSVKWLAKIVVADEESPSQWQRRDYKCFGPNEGDKPDWERYPAIQEMPVTSAVTGVWVGECVRRSGAGWMRGGREGGNRAEAGVKDLRAWREKNPGVRGGEDAEPVAVTGYAYSGGGREIIRVDISVDGGKTWDQAELLKDSAAADEEDNAPHRGAKAWAWKRWRYTGSLPQLSSSDASCTDVIVKATDDAYNTQPEHHSGIYNVRGNLATAWHRVRICPSCTTGQDGRRTWSTGDRVYGCGFRKEKEDEDKKKGNEEEKKKM